MRRSNAPSQGHKRTSSPNQNINLPPKTTRPNEIQDNKVFSREDIIKKLSAPFKCPIPDYVQYSNSTRNLGIRRPRVRRALYDPNMPNALVLYTPPETTQHDKLGKVLVHVVVDPLLANILRPHQREGVKFMYDCVTGIQNPAHFGCIMTDKMGLRKTLQCITLLWTLMRQGPEGKPTFDKAIIVCPSSLVKNWRNEIHKWLGGRLITLIINGGTDAKKRLIQFMQGQGLTANRVLIISYDIFSKYADVLHKNKIGLVICGKGHRLKNCDTQTYRALMGLQTKRRVLLTSTPIQNNLLEYFSLIDFVNEGLLGSASEFKKNFEKPILRGQDSMASEDERANATEKLQMLHGLVNKCLIRPTSALLTKYLPVKFEMIVLCQLTPVQKEIYLNYINSERIKRTMCENSDEKSSFSTLASITTLKKLCNHPDLVLEKILDGAEGFEKSKNLLPPKRADTDVRVQLSTKLLLLDHFLANLKANYTDKIVLVSNYMQTLDLFEKLCKKRGYMYVRLDGSTTIKRRAKLVENFNQPDSQEFIFMVSSKAGGCGLNLIGANRLIMFDPDWNPANDDQAMATVWRDGQQKPCYIYRFLNSGTIEEKIFQRQAHKKALSSRVVDMNTETCRHFSVAELRDLFCLENTESDTHVRLKCKRCINRIQITNPPNESDCTSDLSNWNHTWNKKGLADMVLKSIWDKSNIQFVFESRCQMNKAKPPGEEEEEDAD